MKSKQKLEMIEKIVSEAESTSLMDDAYPPMIVDELRAILDECVCEECGNPGWRRLGRGVSDHYTDCSKYKPAR